MARSITNNWRKKLPDDCDHSKIVLDVTNWLLDRYGYQKQQRIETLNNLCQELDLFAWELRADKQRSEDPKEQIRQAILSGNVEFSSKAIDAIESINLKNPDRSLTNVQVSFWGPNKNCDGGMGIDWITKSAGNGRCDFYIKDGKLRCMNQAMSKEFILSLLQYILQYTELDME